MKSRRKHAKANPHLPPLPMKGEEPRETMLPAWKPLAHDTSTERCAGEYR